MHETEIETGAEAETRTAAWGAAAGCPVDCAARSERKSARAGEPGGVAIERDAAGVWHVRGFEQARAVLRAAETKQAGFRAEVLAHLPALRNLPILYQEGKVHQEQRRQTARFFTPKMVSASYRGLMERLSDQLIAGLVRTRRADLSRISMTLAVRVAGEVVGLTNSRLPGMESRLNAFFAAPPDPAGGRGLARLWRLAHLLVNQRRLLAFYWLDVRPAIAARKRAPREDVISHLIGLGYRDSEILTECVTYGAAGMVTTREFISMAAWHLLERPDLRARYLAAEEAERLALLEETLRLEPVVGALYRRATADLRIESDGAGAAISIPQGDLIAVHVTAANADERVAGGRPLELCPGRELRMERVPASVAGFGDGAHRCPGAYIALQETDIFLRRLLALDGLRIVRPPTVTWADLTASYELRDFLVAL